MHSLRSLFAALLGAAGLAFAPSAAAYPQALLDEARLGPRLEQIDFTPHELWAERPGRAPLWFAIDVGVVRGTTSTGWTGMLLVGLPLDRLGRLHGRGVAEGPASPPSASGAPLPPAPPSGPVLKPAPGRKIPAPETPPPPAKVAPSTTVAERIAIPVPVSPSLARGVVKAALRKAHLLDPGSRTDALASRARASAVLPELRLRVARIVDDGQSLMPTEYDPLRTTATGGTTLWLDGRATWKLDRLVFAEEEVALERIRNERMEAQARLVSRTLEALFLWQKWLARAGDANATAEDHLAAELGVLSAEAELDILTDGWFTRTRAAEEARRPR